MKKGMHFHTKLFINYSVIITVLIMFSLVACYFYISRLLENRAVENMSQLTQKTSEQLDGLLTGMDRIALYIVTNPVVRDIFSSMKTSDRQSNYFEQNIPENKKVYDILAPLNVPNDQFYRISLFDAYGNYFSMGIPDSVNAIHRRTSSDYYTQWYGTMLPSDKNRFIAISHQDFWSDDENLVFISLLREIKDFDTYTSFGLVEVQQSYDKLKSILKLSNEKDLKVYLFDKDGSIIFPYNSLNNNEERESADYYHSRILVNINDNTEFLNPQTRKHELLTYFTSNLSGWTVVTVQTKENLIAPARFLGWVITLAGIGILLLTLAVVYVISNNLTKPLKQLRKSVSSINLDNLHAEITYTDNNEIMQLNKAFKEMLARMKDSMEQVVYLRSREIKSQLLVLQSQMDPHFLYNMLSVISAAGQDDGNMKIMNMCCKLSNMLRYTTSSQHKDVMIKDELEHIKNYLDLMKERYEDRLTYTIHEDAAILEIGVPKLILQPIIENCFRHGFKGVSPPWDIRVSVGQIDNCWFMKVCDNGRGFNKKELSDLLQRVESISAQALPDMQDLKLGGLGLLNTFMRLKILYSGNVIFKIGNNGLKGANVMIGGNIP